MREKRTASEATPLVAYHLQGQNPRFTVWPNGRLNSKLVNSVWVSIAFAICTIRQQNRCERLKRVSKTALTKFNMNFLSQHSDRERDYLFTKRFVVFHLPVNLNFRKVL